MKLDLKKSIAAILIYEIVLITFIIVLKPFGSHISRGEWETFWTWFFVPPIAFLIILFIIIWAIGAKIELGSFKNFNFSKRFSKKNISLSSVKRFFSNFINGKLSLPLSFFGFGFLGTTIMSTITFLIFQHTTPVRLIGGLWQIYAIIGIWSAADKYKGKKIFSILAKIIMIWWIMNNIVRFIIDIS